MTLHEPTAMWAVIPGVSADRPQVSHHWNMSDEIVADRSAAAAEQQQREHTGQHNSFDVNVSH
jgi:hypothetical protein